MTNSTMTESPVSNTTATPREIVVAVDGSEHNLSAVGWASCEARATGEALTLITAIDDHLAATPFFSISAQDQQALDMLARVRSQTWPQPAAHAVGIEAVVGSPVAVLLERAKKSAMVVVGKRGLGSFGRLIVGSTSIAVAGRAEVPTVIVPDAWNSEAHEGATIVVGIDPYRPEHDALRVAFERAERTGARLTAVHGWEQPTVYSWDQAASVGSMATWEAEASAEFDRVLDTWRKRFPEVDVVDVHSSNHPATAVLEAADKAQLIVLGRHPNRKIGGFAFGSVTRAVLHYSECPVMVVPGG